MRKIQCDSPNVPKRVWRSVHLVPLAYKQMFWKTKGNSPIVYPVYAAWLQIFPPQNEEYEDPPREQT